MTRHTRRREFIAGLWSAAGWPLAVWAQLQTKPIIGWLEVQLGGPRPEFVEGFRHGLAEIGFWEGRDVTVEYHLADGHFERLPALVADLIRRRPAAILATQNNSALAAKAVTRDIPIIFGAAYDLVELGLVANLNRPTSRASPNLAARSLKSALSCYTKRCRPLKQ